MTDSKLRVELERTVDGNGNTYYIGKLKAPITIDCKDGVCFVIFTSQIDNEEMQINSILPPKPKIKYNDRRNQKF
jgi:hypothetical protein